MQWNGAMGAARLWVAAELRRLWPWQLALALLVGLVGAVVLTCAAGARRTLTAYERFNEAQVIPDVEVQVDLDHESIEALGRLEGVEAAGVYVPFMAAPSERGLAPGRDFVVFAAADETYSITVDRPLVLAGRLPDPNAADEVVAGQDTAARLGLEVGNDVLLDSLSSSQAEAVFGGSVSALGFEGPRSRLRVVGIVRTRLDVADAGTVPGYFLATPSFYEQNSDRMLFFGELLDVRLLEGAAGVDEYITAVRQRVVDNPDDFSFERLGEALTNVENSTRSQALALYLVALAAAVAGVVVIAQAARRTVEASADAHYVLGALGMGRTRRRMLAAATLLPAAVAGSGFAVAGAFAASLAFPSGLAGDLEIDPGRHIDPLVLLPGAVALVALVSGSAASAAPRRVSGTLQTRRGLGSTPLERLTGTLRPANLVGIRWALTSPTRSSLPSGAALAAATLGVAAVVAAFEYGGALSRLVTTPSAYGWTYDADAGGGDDPDAVAELRDALLEDDAVGDLAVVRVVGNLAIDGEEMQAFGFESMRGSIEVAVLQGRAPAAHNEVVLGSKSARAIGAGIGDLVHAHSVQGSTVALRVVGLGIFPPIESNRFANGAAVLRQTLDRLVTSQGFEEVVFRWATGVDTASEAARLREDFKLNSVVTAPADIQRLQLIQRYPAALAAFLALLACAAATHWLYTSVRHRRHDVAVLRTIGFTDRQVVRAVVTQGFTFGLIAIVIGLPLGMALGRRLWTIQAYAIGVGGPQSLSSDSAALVAAAAFTVLGIIALAAAAKARGQSAFEALRSQ
jgi:FtsX-like permease family